MKDWVNCFIQYIRMSYFGVAKYLCKSNKRTLKEFFKMSICLGSFALRLSKNKFIAAMLKAVFYFLLL